MIRLISSVALMSLLSIAALTHIFSSDSESINGYSSAAFIILECPSDTSILCTESTDPANLGMPSVTAGEMASFSDSVILACPDKVIRRMWVANDNGVATDTCIQMITLKIDSVSNDFDPIEQISGFCTSDIDSLVRAAYNLNCNESFSNVVALPQGAQECGAQQFFVTYNIADDCTSQIRAVSQVFQLINIPPLSLENIQIDSANTSDGGVSYGIMHCQEGMLSYDWTNSEGMSVSTDSTLAGVRAGTYTLNITSSVGCVDSFTFVIPQIGAIFINCPADITIGCDDNISDTNLTGIATGSTGERSFQDSVIQECPVQIVQRTWFLSDENNALLDSCVQMITVQADVAMMSDTLRFMGMCPEPISSFVQSIELQCHEVLDSSDVMVISESCNMATYAAQYFITDNCADSTYTRTQVLEFSNIPFITLSNISTRPDGGDTSGTITFDYMQCRSGDLAFAWSNGSTDTTLMGLTAGDYTLTVTGPQMCVDSFLFTIAVIAEDIVCPADVTVDCDASIDPINLGFPMGGAMEDFTYTDSITQECPMTIIERRWVRNMSTAAQDLCIQTITLDPANVRANFADTTVVTGVCGSDLEVFVDKDLPLACGERIIDVRTILVSSSCEEVVYSTNWFGADDCNGGATFTASQVTIFRDIPVAELSNIMITPDPNGNGGAISFDASACKDDNLSYMWSDSSTAMSLDSVNSGSYSVTITNEMGCTQSVDFVVPIFLSLTCPADITIDCTQDALPSVTGMPSVAGFDSVTYFDVVVENCPNRVTERSWVTSISGGSLDTCVQVITQTDDNLRTNFMDTLFVSGQCSGMLDSLIAGTLPLGCNERIDFMATDSISADCNREMFRTDWLVFNECTGRRTTISQVTVFDQLKAIEVSNTQISSSIGDTSGTISFDFSSCKGDSVMFNWSNGSTTAAVSGLASGTYTVTATTAAGCMEVLSFDVPLSFGLICPADVVISCTEMPDTSITGIATLEGFDSLTFVDSIIQVCPNTIIERTFTGSSMNAESVSCTQLITLSNENVGADFQDTVRVSGACAADLQNLLIMTPPLRCGESISSQNVSNTDPDCNTQTFQIDWFIFDECTNRTRIESQVTIFEDIAVIDMTDLVVTPDQEDNSGAISFGHTVCMGDTATFLWSTGSTAANIASLPGGTYGLTVTNSIGCIDSFSFEVPFLFSLDCPANISLSCVQEPTTDITGEARINGYEILTFSDSTTQSCPDRIIQRTWTAMTADSSESETCTQIITLRSDINTVRDGFPFMTTLSGVCTTDALANPASLIPLACSERLDSTNVVVIRRGCDQDVINFSWFITDMCMDSSYSVGQAVVFDNVPVITLDSVDIQGAQGGSNGSIQYSFSQCGSDSLSFIWNDLSTNPFISNITEGEYELRVTNSAGCRDTFTFIVPTDFSVVCPDDITIDCTESPDTSVTGVPLTFGFMDFTFSDSIIQMCPDQVIQRTFMAVSDTSEAMCVQTITLQTNDDIRDNFPDTMIISGQCPGDISSIVVDQLPLSCNESVDSSSMVMVSEGCMNAEYMVTWSVSDACSGNAFSVSQTVMFDSIPFVSLSNTSITRDDGSGNGSVDFDVDFCVDNALTFAWSDGSSNKSLIGVEGGVYMVTISNDVGCSEVFNFEVPAPLPFDSTKALTLNVVNREDEIFEGVNVRFLSSVGREEIRADLFNEDGGEYVYVIEGELSEIGFVCPSFEDAAIKDVSSIDIVRGQRLILGISESCPEDFVAADVNFSGGPSAADLVLIRRVILGLDQDFPDNESWRFVKNEEIDINNLSTPVAGCIPVSAADLQNQTMDLKGIKLGNLECAN